MNEKYFLLLDQINKEQQENITMNSKILLVDGLNTYIRSYIKTPTMNDDGIHIGGITGFLNSIGYALKLTGATRCILVFDGKGGSVRRRKLFPNYKGNRRNSINFNRTYHFKSSNEEEKNMARQLSRLMEYVQCMPVSIVSIDNIEADDAISYISKNLYNKNENKIIIMSSDKDFLQLVDDRIQVWSPTKKIMYDKNKILNEYGIYHENFIYYRILDGDKSDNIPGINGIGLKIIKKHFNFLSDTHKIKLDDIYVKCEINKSKYKILNTILENKQQLELNYKLMQLSDVDISSHSKMSIINSLNKTVPTVNKFALRKLYIADNISPSAFNLMSFVSDTLRNIYAYSNKL